MTEQELTELRSHGIAVFRNRVIFNAQPPIDSDTLAWVQAQCSGPIPQPLLDLWANTAGGNINYTVNIKMGDEVHSFSWTELFFRGATTYYDLDGWIKHELELAEQSAAETGAVWTGTLDWLPIGGFEYLDRAYVRVANDSDHGMVLLWMQGLPPAWVGRLHQDTSGSFAIDLNSAFDKLFLAEHPVHGIEQYRTGLELVEYLDDRVDSHGLAQSLADRLIDFYAEAVVVPPPPNTTNSGWSNHE